MRSGRTTAVVLAALIATVATIGGVRAAGDLSRQDPIEVKVELGKPGSHVFVPSRLRFETGKLYKLVLTNPSNDPHYFTSHAFTQLIYTRKVQVTQMRDGKLVTLAEFKGAIREIEVYPGHSAEWWLCRSRPAASPTCNAASAAATARRTRITAWSARSSSNSRTRNLLICPALIFGDDHEQEFLDAPRR
jgi:uncharacterized cupredoxin-like copper-binding protein